MYFLSGAIRRHGKESRGRVAVITSPCLASFQETHLYSGIDFQRHWVPTYLWSFPLSQQQTSGPDTLLPNKSLLLCSLEELCFSLSCPFLPILSWLASPLPRSSHSLTEPTDSEPAPFLRLGLSPAQALVGTGARMIPKKGRIFI